ncbi:hypothetical protein L211DRAFT_341283 [Terfezia boudieri ATCC MYA-4762]|uniref:Uncharacterized protein n=1 Tax=Terfezia boudieri ATCC MYA-4762 TaxID=1051890 RepID=A0A3N4LL86_9PEZI|nr:hypothetical protein L211DRAFT_341283 [Terfezia boudieri ATCC MYA-4762]
MIMATYNDFKILFFHTNPSYLNASTPLIGIHYPIWEVLAFLFLFVSAPAIIRTYPRRSRMIDYMARQFSPKTNPRPFIRRSRPGCSSKNDRVFFFGVPCVQVCLMKLITGCSTGCSQRYGLTGRAKTHMGRSVRAHR